MIYSNIRAGEFIKRPNRFIAHVKIEGQIEVCHVKNTGRCKELLIPGTTVIVQEHDNPGRKTRFSLIGVKKGERLINIDSQAPNHIVHEWLKKGNLFPDATLIKPETTHGGSRFDFYVETPGRKIFMEVKGVTLEENGVVRFPDAPTERGVKHLQHLRQSIQEGYEAYVVFVAQMKGVDYFTPNVKTHQAFADALIQAEHDGVRVLAFDCDVTEGTLEIGDPVRVVLQP